MPDDASADDVYVISVTDSGPGIDAELQQRIFDPFFSTKGPGPGRGLGLATSLGIARSHGGWISVESTPGEGATFRLSLPRDATSAEPIVVPAAA